VAGDSDVVATNTGVDPLFDRYASYIAAFNARDLAAVSAFLTEDVRFDWAEGLPPLVGRNDFLGFFAHAWEHLREHIEISDVAVVGDELSAWITNTIITYRDWPDCPFRPLHVGTSFTVSGRVLYRFRGLRISHVVEQP